MNEEEKCKGQVTRINTKNKEEKSAIDFIVVNNTVEKWIKQMPIDEEGLIRIRGKNDTDHNTISIEMEIKDIEKIKKD